MLKRVQHDGFADRSGVAQTCRSHRTFLERVRLLPVRNDRLARTLKAG